jgi:hypothetical protein
VSVTVALDRGLQQASDVGVGPFGVTKQLYVLRKHLSHFPPICEIATGL